MMYAHGCHGNLLSFYIIHNIILYHWLTYYMYYDINSQPYMYRMIYDVGVELYTYIATVYWVKLKDWNEWHNNYVAGT